MLIQSLGEDKDNDNDVEEEEESVKKHSKALARVTSPKRRKKS